MLTFDQLKEKLRIQNTPQTPNPSACGYNDDGPIDPWDEDDEATWLAGYSQYCPPAATTVLAEQLKQEQKVVTEQEKKEMDHFWQALILLTECSKMFETLLQLDTRKDFLSPNNHKELTDLLADVEDLVDQYDFKEIHE